MQSDQWRWNASGKPPRQRKRALGTLPDDALVWDGRRQKLTADAAASARTAPRSGSTGGGGDDEPMPTGSRAATPFAATPDTGG